MLENLLIKNPQPIFIYDIENLRFLEVNPAAEQLYGYNRNEFLQMDLTDLYTPEDIQTLLETNNKRNGAFSGPYKQRRKDGATLYVEISRTDITFQEKPAHFNIVRDITSELERDKETELYRIAFNATDELVFITDRDGFVTSINDAVVDTLGFARTDVIDSTIVSFIDDDHRAEISQKLIYEKSENAFELELSFKKVDGSLMKGKFVAEMILDHLGEVDSYLIIGKVNRGGKVIEKKVPVERVVYKEARAGFGPEQISYIFHEILTPVNVILGFIYELEDTIGELNEEQREFIDIINQNKGKLLYTMDSVAEFSMIESELESIKLERVNISEILSKLEADNKESNNPAKKNLSFSRVTRSLEIETDRKKFEKFLFLIVKIASHLTDQNQIYISAFENDDDTYSLSFRDRHDGVSDTLLTHLQSVFQKPDIMMLRQFGMSRFTVSLCRKLFLLFNAKLQKINRSGIPYEVAFTFTKAPKLRIDEAIKEGGVFTTLGAKSKDLAVEEEPVSENVESFIITAETAVNPIIATRKRAFKNGEIILSAMSCMLLEDQSDSQMLFKVQMKELNELRVAKSFEEALPLLQNNQYDFIVMDINLEGEYNGLDALKIVRQIKGMENVPVIAATAYVLPGDREKFITAGFNDFIAKPIFKEKMVEVLKGIFK